MRGAAAALAALTLLALPSGLAATPPPAIAFGTPVFLPGTDRGRAVVVADVTGDGKNDVVIAGWQDAQVVVYAGNGEGLFAAPRAYLTTLSHVWHMIAGDLNGDGAADLVIDATSVLAGPSSGGVEVLLSDGAGGLAATFYPAPDGDPYETEAPALIDWNGDGAPDVLTVSRSKSRVRLNDGAGRLSAPIAAPFAPANDVAVADFDSDGRTDVFTDDWPSSVDKIHFRLGDGSFAAAQPVPNQIAFPVGEWPQVADLDGDGYLDVVGNQRHGNGADGFIGVARHAAPQALSTDWYFVAGPAFLAAPSGTFYSVPTEGMALADLNKDGRPDVVTSRGIKLNQGDGTFGTPNNPAGYQATTITLPVPRGYWIAAGDLDGDGVPEIVTTYGADVGGVSAAAVIPVELAGTHIGLASIAPSTLYQGATTDVTITGSGFKEGDVVDFGAGIAVNTTTVSSATSLAVNVTVSPSAATGFRSVKVTNPDGGHGKLWYAVVVAPNGAATVGGLSPDHGHAGDTLDVDVFGYGFIAGLPTAASLGAGVTVNAASVVYAGRARMNITIAADAALGLRDLTWTNGTGVQWTATNAFNVLRRRSIDLSLVAGRITKKKKAGHGTFTVAGGLAFNQASADGLFDPTKDAVRVRFGDPAAPSVVDVAAGSTWRVKGGRFTWKTDKKANKKTNGPHVTLTIDLDRHSFALSVAGMDVATGPFGTLVVDVELGSDYGITTRTFEPMRRRGYVLR